MASLGGINPTEVSDTDEFGLGTRGSRYNTSMRVLSGDKVPVGNQEYIYVRAEANVAVGDVMIIKPDWDVSGVTEPKSRAMNFGCGVVVAAMQNGQYGWIQVFGYSPAIKVAAGYDTANKLYTTGSGGVLDDTQGSEREVKGIRCSSRAGSGATVDGYLIYPNVNP